jgi:site-specific DNA recombinase
LSSLYCLSGVSAKQELIRSIFPEKLSFDGEICRTERINDVLRFILQIDKDLPENKRGDFSNKLELSRLVAPAGIEPASKL